jgi:hypothetical protein
MPLILSLKSCEAVKFDEVSLDDDEERVDRVEVADPCDPLEASATSDCDDLPVV